MIGVNFDSFVHYLLESRKLFLSPIRVLFGNFDSCQTSSVIMAGSCFFKLKYEMSSYVRRSGGDIDSDLSNILVRHFVNAMEFLVK